MTLAKPVADLTEEDLQSLVDQTENESRALDYKEMQVFGAEAKKDELRKDVTAFANSAGGDLVIGVRDVEGEPAELCGVDLGGRTAEQYQNTLLDIIQTRIKPRIQGHPPELGDPGFLHSDCCTFCLASMSQVMISL